jgi:polyisoprenoid-binding protein YceI
MATTKSRKWMWWIGGGIVVVIAALVLGPYIYIHFIEPDPAPKLSISNTPPPTNATTDGSAAKDAALTGTWNITTGSKGQYRVKEVLFGQDSTATGVTDKVTGSATFDGTTVKTAKITVDLTGLSSDSGNRDNQVQGRILETSQFPDATFELTQPITLPSDGADGKEMKVTATGNLTLHGVTKPVTTEITARRSGSTIEASGAIPIKFSDYQINDPSGGPAKVGDDGSLEYLVVLSLA